MSQQDFANLLDTTEQNELLKMVDVLFTEEAKRIIVLSQPEPILNSIRDKLNLPMNYELGEVIHRLDRYALTDVIKTHLTREIMIDELNTLSKETKTGLIKYYNGKSKN